MWGRVSVGIVSVLYDSHLLYKSVNALLKLVKRRAESRLVYPAVYNETEPNNLLWQCIRKKANSSLWLDGAHGDGHAWPRQPNQLLQQ